MREGHDLRGTTRDLSDPTENAPVVHHQIADPHTIVSSNTSDQAGEILADTSKHDLTAHPSDCRRCLFELEESLQAVGPSESGF